LRSRGGGGPPAYNLSDDPGALEIEKAVAIGGARQHAGFGAAEDAVTVTGHEAVSPVSKAAGNEMERGSDQEPDATSARWERKYGVGRDRTGRGLQVFEEKDNRIRARQEKFAGKIRMDDNIDGVEIASVGSVAGENASRKRALERGKAKESGRVAAQDELIHPIAEPADSVVEQDGLGHGVRMTLAFGGNGAGSESGTGKAFTAEFAEEGRRGR
jgi:hypothetical protein